MILSLSFKTTAMAIFQILLMGACGYVLYRKRVINEATLDLLTRLLMNFLLPLFMFYYFTQNFSFERYTRWWIFPLISFGITLGAMGVAYLVSLLYKRLTHKKEFVALVTFQNSGYIPLLLIATLFNQETAQVLFVYIFLFLIGFNIGIWTLAVWWLTDQRNERTSIREMFSPPFVAILFSLILIFFGWHRFIPGVMLKPMKMFSDCVLPIAMIMVGGSLARIRITDVKPTEIIVLVLTKLILLPLLALGIIRFFQIDFLIGLLIMLETVVPSAVSLSVITRHYKIEEKFINQGLFYGHLVSLLTIPLFLMLYTRWYY